MAGTQPAEPALGWPRTPAAMPKKTTQPVTPNPRAQDLFWKLAAELHAEDPRVVEGTIMGGKCLRVGKEFLALVDFKGSGLVVKLPKARVGELIAAGTGEPFAPAGKVFAEWVAIPRIERARWAKLLREGVAFVGGGG